MSALARRRDDSLRNSRGAYAGAYARRGRQGMDMSDHSSLSAGNDAVKTLGRAILPLAASHLWCAAANE